MTNKSLAILLSLSSACGLIKVNGKPLGGGGSSTSSTPASSSASEPEATKTESYGAESPAESDARWERGINEKKKADAASKAGLPAMCTEHSIATPKDVDLKKFDDLDRPEHDWTDDARNFADVMCSTRGEHLDLRPQVMSLRTKWMKQHGLDENDFTVLVLEKMGRSWPRQKLSEIPGPVAQTENASLTNLDQYGSNTSMLARVSFVEGCLPEVRRKGVLQKILCVTEPLDPGKGMAEIDAAPDINIGTRYHLRRRVWNAVSAQTAMREELTKEAKDDPGIAKLVAIAEAQRKDWAAPNATRTKLARLLESMEAATVAKKRSAFAGCETTTRAAWADAVKAAELPAVAEKDVLATMMNAVFTTPEAYLAYRALELCADGMDASFTSRLDVIGASQERRGPRSSTIAAWSAASGEIKFDSKELKMFELLRDVGASGGSHPMRVNVGTIDKVVVTAGGVHVSFRPDTFEYEDCINWRSTGRISRIETNGAVSYQQICTQTGRVKFDRKPDDVTMSAFIGTGLKSGMLLMVAVEESFPIVATASSKSTKAAWLFGVALK